MKIGVPGHVRLNKLEMSWVLLSAFCSFLLTQAYAFSDGNKPYPVQQYVQSPHPMPTTLGGLEGIVQQAGIALTKAGEGMVTSIHEAITFMRADAIEDMLQKNPALANEKGRDCEMLGIDRTLPKGCEAFLHTLSLKVVSFCYSYRV